ncbi:(2Fe-2S)-binding protein [Methylomagnum sp.]
MYICICKNVTDGQIRKAVREKGVNNMRALRQELGACDQCGKCAVEARQLIRDCLNQQAMAESRSLLAGQAVLVGA